METLGQLTSSTRLNSYSGNTVYNQEYYAWWTGATYTVTLSFASVSSAISGAGTTNGWTYNASAKTYTKSVQNGTTFGTLPAPALANTVAGYGWFTSTSGGTQIYSTTTFTGTANTTYYLQITYKKYSVKAVVKDANGNETEYPVESDVNAGSTVNLPSTITVDGKTETVAGWMTSDPTLNPFVSTNDSRLITSVSSDTDGTLTVYPLLLSLTLAFEVADTAVYVTFGGLTYMLSDPTETEENLSVRLYIGGVPDTRIIKAQVPGSQFQSLWITSGTDVTGEEITSDNYPNFISAGGLSYDYIEFKVSSVKSYISSHTAIGDDAGYGGKAYMLLTVVGGSGGSGGGDTPSADNVCSSCGTVANYGGGKYIDGYCDICGTQLYQTYWHCPNCGNSWDVTSCPNSLNH